MKTRPTPNPINYRRPLPAGLKTDPQVMKWSKRLAGDQDARPWDLNEEQLAYVIAEVLRRRTDISTTEVDQYLKAMAETCPVVAAPELERDKLAEDLGLLFAQPEMAEFYASWDGQRGPSGPAPNFATSKALMTVVGVSGISAHADDCYAELAGGEQALWSLFSALETEPPLRPSGYRHACKQMPKLAGGIGDAIATNVKMVRALAELHPGRGIGERLLIDGMPLPAWCKQVGLGKTERQEAWRRRNTPEAGARAIKYDKSGKTDVEHSDSAKRVLSTGGKFWRGYWLVVIADQATGLPLVWTIHDAKQNENTAIVPLLSDLYRLWPECPAKVIAGDSAWDQDAWCRLCEVDYGIHPIFRLHQESKPQDVEGFSRDGSVTAYTKTGQLICAEHRELLEYAGAEAPVRDGLRPGQTAPEGEFRVRGECTEGCGKLALRMKTDWSKLTFYPHFRVGRASETKHAYRRAMLVRLNGIEGIFERLQIGRKLGTEGADRTRIRNKGAHEMIISLGLLSMTAATLADQRRQRGINYPAPGTGSSGGGTGHRQAIPPIAQHGQRSRGLPRRQTLPQSDSAFGDVDVMVGL